MKLYVCWGTFRSPRPGGHPCRNAHEALKDAGWDPEVEKAYGLGILGDSLNPTRRKVRELFGDRVEWGTLERDNLEITAFKHPRDYAEHFKGLYGPTIVARNNAVQNGKEAEFDEALNKFPDEWNLGTEDDARFEQEYLVVVGTRR